MMSCAKQIAAGLGEAANILRVEPCLTRIRVEVRNPALVDDEQLKDAGALAIVRAGTVVQIVVGQDAEELCRQLSVTP